MRVTRKKALLFAEAACRAYERRPRPIGGGMTITLPEDFAKTDWPYDVAMSTEGHLLIRRKTQPVIGIPYHRIDPLK